MNIAAGIRHVTDGYLRQTVVDLFKAFSGYTRFVNFVQYSITVFSLPELASDVIFAAVIEYFSPDVLVKFGCCASQRSRFIRQGPFVLNDEQQQILRPIILSENAIAFCLKTTTNDEK